MKRRFCTLATLRSLGKRCFWMNLPQELGGNLALRYVYLKVLRCFRDSILFPRFIKSKFDAASMPRRYRLSDDDRKEISNLPLTPEDINLFWELLGMASLRDCHELLLKDGCREKLLRRCVERGKEGRYPDAVAKIRGIFEYLFKKKIGDFRFSHTHIMDWGIYLDRHDERSAKLWLESSEELSSAMGELASVEVMSPYPSHGVVMERDTLYLILPVSVSSEPVITSMHGIFHRRDLKAVKLLMGGVLALAFSPSTGDFAFQRVSEYQFLSYNRPRDRMQCLGRHSDIKDRVSRPNFITLLKVAIRFLKKELKEDELSFVAELAQLGLGWDVLPSSRHWLWKYRGNMRRKRFVKQNVLLPLIGYLRQVVGESP